MNVTQLTTRCRVATIMCIAGAVVALTYLSTFSTSQLSWQLLVGIASVLIFYAMLLLASQTWLRAPDKAAIYASRMRWMVTLQVLLGVSWSATMVFAVQVADENQRRMVYALAIALISTTMVSGPAKYAFSFWLPITIGSFVTYAADYGHHYRPILVALLCYAFLSAYSIVVMNRRILEQERNLFEIERHSETIELLLKDFQEGSGSFLWETDAQLRITDFSGSPDLFSAVKPLYGRTGFIDFLTSFLTANPTPSSDHSGHWIDDVSYTMAAKLPFKDILVRQESPRGVRWWAVSGKPLFNHSGQFFGYRGLWSDVTDRQEYKVALEIAANRDDLTQIYNRAAFNTRFPAFCKDRAEGQAALICLDLDYFKRVNDNFGHPIGDTLLVAVAARIKACLGPMDMFFRLGGDEFAILLSDTDRSRVQQIAQHIISELCEPFLIDGIRIRIGASIGIALIPPEPVRPETLHHHADMALYKSKTSGRCKCTIFDDGLEDPFPSSQAIRFGLADNIPIAQFYLVYQPIVELGTARIIGAEALLRWHHPDLGAVSPVDFIPMIETTGQIENVGLFVIEQAAQLAAQLADEIFIAVNLSPIQLTDIDLPKKIGSILCQAGASPAKIEFEITEGTTLERAPQKLKVLQEIRALGCRISLDDFGTGYASMLLLERFPFDKIKVDSAFTHSGEGRNRRQLILSAILTLAAKLGVAVVAEGIETADQAAHLLALGCRLGQGFHFGRGLIPNEFLSALDADRLSPDLPQLTNPVTASG